ncbi:hypothetical protein SEA_GUANICA15_4 [Mycobacterium phage Guanica15]|uniref:Uncharacterized protein n=1 Tax=Mycobacterium phage Yunkel11 TaxID=2599886 RepID=A0A5J6TBU7_9CAUD|nr:hypothetical protein I5H09_gp004 [Mycobacterium phage Yunkel11]QFG08393.1 hypothetical protein SEA_YUNKEL11_4 [Mycobacterium phage Yunkel11]QFG11617.1 hypothetical protein SEA_GUANICA15_4 [Mycobacterium phage Guanica15]
MTPTVGRVVHYHRPGLLGAAPLAALITEVVPRTGGGYVVGLVAFDPVNACQRFMVAVPFAENPTPGCWNWPPRN